MALSDQWQRGLIRAAVRRSLMDPNATWWSDAELNEYIGAWQDYLQEKFEFVYNTATVTTGTTTLAMTAIATDILRLDAIYWNDYRLAGRSKDELEMDQRDWRAASASTPAVAYQDDIYSVSFWPPPTAVGTVVFEYPKLLTFIDDTTTMAIPAWTKYSVVDYCAARAYLRAGPNQDLQKFNRRKARFARHLARIVNIYEQHFPDRTPSLRPSIDASGVFQENAARYEGDILNIGKNTTLFQTWY